MKSHLGSKKKNINYLCLQIRKIEDQQAKQRATWEREIVKITSWKWNGRKEVWFAKACAWTKKTQIKEGEVTKDIKDMCKHQIVL